MTAHPPKRAVRSPSMRMGQSVGFSPERPVSLNRSGGNQNRRFRREGNSLRYQKRSFRPKKPNQRNQMTGPKPD